VAPAPAALDPAVGAPVVVGSGRLMTSLYDTLADGCAALAAKTKHKLDKARLRQLVEQWRSVAADQKGEAVRRPFAIVDEPTASAPLAKPPARKSAQPLRHGRPKKSV
jgi:hypothetical protein